MENLQNKYIVENIEEIFADYVKGFDELEMTFEQFVGLKTGMWQCDNGFYLSVEQVFETLDKKRKNVEEE